MYTDTPLRGFRCDQCGGKTEVLVTGPVVDAAVTRQRKCLACAHQLRTIEVFLPPAAGGLAGLPGAVGPTLLGGIPERMS